MKKLLILSLLSLLLLPASCSQMEEAAIYGDVITKAEAQHFVDSLMTAFREGTMERLRCPRVRWEHIPALLEYGKSTVIVGDDPFSGSARALPANPISSYLMTQCSEGMFALWMVEAARINTLYKGNPPERDYCYGWPSQNSFVQKQDASGPTWYVNDEKVQKEVLEAYQSWWIAAKGHRSAASINPLEDTGYAWH